MQGSVLFARGKIPFHAEPIQFVQFRNPSPGVVVLIEKDGQVLLGRRSGNYGAKKWGLPQGFIEFDEDFLTAAIREVKEEAGLDVEIRSIISVVSNFLSPRLHTLAIVLLARVVGGELCAADDLEAVAWFSLCQFSPGTGPLIFGQDGPFAEVAQRQLLRIKQMTDTVC